MSLSELPPIGDAVGYVRDEKGRFLVAPPTLKSWKPGQSGNPSGKSGEYTKCLVACRADSMNNVNTLQELRDHSTDDRVRYMAATYLHERAWGKAPTFDPKAERDTVQTFDPASLSPEQLQVVKAAMTLLAQAMTAVEVDTSDVLGG